MKSEVNTPIAKFRFSQGEFEISGSEQFVKEQIENFKPSIQDCLVQLAKSFPQSTQLLPAKQQKLLPTETKSNLNERMEDVEFVEVTATTPTSYENVLAIENGHVQIITDIPGDSLAKRMINVILIYLWGKLQLTIDEVPFIELRKICERHGEIDKPNFAKHMHSNKKYFLVGGSGKNQYAKLIRPGIKEAIKVISELNK